MKIKSLVVTKNNIEYVYGIIRKFFYNKKKTAFEVWSKDNCGFDKHIKNSDSYGVFTRPLEIEMRESGIFVELDHIYSFYLNCGNKIAFMGNGIFFKFNIHSGCYRYVFFQSKEMSQEEQERRFKQREEEVEYFNNWFFKGIREDLGKRMEKL